MCVGRQAGGHVDVLPLNVANAHFVCDVSFGGQAMARPFSRSRSLFARVFPDSRQSTITNGFSTLRRDERPDETTHQPSHQIQSQFAELVIIVMMTSSLRETLRFSPRACDYTKAVTAEL